MTKLFDVISGLQSAGLVVQGLPLDEASQLAEVSHGSMKELLVALMTKGRMHGVYVYQDQANFDRFEFSRKLGELGFSREEAVEIMSNLRPSPTPELAALGGRD